MNQIIYVGKHLLTYSVTRHAHTNWEFIYCTGGEGFLTFDDLTLSYGEGDIAVIPPYVPHTNDSSEGFTNIHINMADPTLSLKTPTIIKDDSNRFIRNAFAGAFYHYSSAPGQQTPILLAYGTLVASYLSSYQEAPAYSKVVSEIESNIIQNYPDPNYELDTYLRSFPFSYDYLRKLFKKEVGVTPHQYLIDKRLQTAAESLCSPLVDGSNISEIARMCGFREPLYFSRIFKSKYGVSPSRYQLSKVDGSLSAQDPESMKITLFEE